MAVLNELEPKEVFRFFEEISAIPRGSRDTKRISDYLMAFAKERDLKVIQDEVNNVIIFQPGTPGYEESEPVILQGHMDMVCEKTSDSTHDFKNDGLELYVEDGFLKAKDTTLGGDDGVAVAMALALMDSEDIPHPPIEAVFTVDGRCRGYRPVSIKRKETHQPGFGRREDSDGWMCGRSPLSGTDPGRKGDCIRRGDQDYDPGASGRTFRRRNPQTTW